MCPGGVHFPMCSACACIGHVSIKLMVYFSVPSSFSMKVAYSYMNYVSRGSSPCWFMNPFETNESSGISLQKTHVHTYTKKRYVQFQEFTTPLNLS